MSICGSWKCLPAWVADFVMFAQANGTEMMQGCLDLRGPIRHQISEMILKRLRCARYALSIFTWRDFADLHNNYFSLVALDFLLCFLRSTPFTSLFSCVGIFFLESAKSRRRLSQIFWIKNTFTHRMTTHRPKFGWFSPLRTLFLSFPASENRPQTKKIVCGSESFLLNCNCSLFRSLSD